MHLASHRLSERCSVSFFLFFLLPIPLPAFSGQEPDLTFHALVQKSAASATFRYLCQRREDERCCRLLAPHSQLQGQTEASMGCTHQHLAIAAVLLLAAHAHASDLSAVIATRIKIEVRCRPACWIADEHCAPEHSPRPVVQTHT